MRHYDGRGASSDVGWFGEVTNRTLLSRSCFSDRFSFPESTAEREKSRSGVRAVVLLYFSVLRSLLQSVYAYLFGHVRTRGEGLSVSSAHPRDAGYRGTASFGQKPSEVCCRVRRSDCRGQPQVVWSGRCTDRHDAILNFLYSIFTTSNSTQYSVFKNEK